MAKRNTFSTVATDVNRNKIIYVETLNAFPDPVLDEITLPDDCPAYIWTRELNTEDIKVLIPDTSTADVSFTALNGVANSWTTEITTGETLVSSTAGRRLNFDSLEVNSVNGGTFISIESSTGTRPLLAQSQQLISGFDKIGTINGMLVFSENIGYVNNADGVVYIDLSSVTLSEIIFALQSGNHITLQGDLDSGNFNNVEANPSTGDAVFDIDSGMVITNKITIRDCSVYMGNGGTLFAAGSLDQTDPKVVCFNNGNELDSYWVGSTGFTDGTTETVFSDTTTWVKIAGTYVDGYSERTSHVAGVSTYFGEQLVYVDLVGSAKILMNPAIETDIIQVALFKNSVEVPSTRVVHSLDAVFQTPTSPEFNPRENVLLEKDDTYEIRARNISNATNVIFTDAKTTQRK